MSDFALKIEDVFKLGDHRQGVTLVGPPSDTSGGLAVGDLLLVQTKGGADVRCECVGFPLVNLGQNEPDGSESRSRASPRTKS